MAYNQTANGQSVRIGNWFEEIRLKDDTGIRFYAPPSTKNSSLLTKSRCIEHTDQVKAKDYTTTVRSTLKDPRLHPEYGNGKPAAGPKQRLLASTFRAEIDDELKQKASADYTESRIVDYRSTGQDSYKKEGFRPTMRENDPSARVSTRNASYSTDTAVTIYSHALKYPNERVYFPATFVGTTNPFSKHNAFSADIAHNTLARRTESNERPKSLPTLQEYKVLNAFRARLLEAARGAVGSARGAAVRYMAEVVEALDADFISVQEFKDYISNLNFGIKITLAEERSLISAYDYRSSGQLFLPEIITLLRPSPTARRAELIHIFFSQLPSPQVIDQEDGVVMTMIASEQVQSLLRRSGLHAASKAASELQAFLQAMPASFSAQDFFYYFADISAEMETDYEFEEYMKGMWEAVLA